MHARRHVGWVWCVRNFLAGGSRAGTLGSPEAALFFRHGEMEDAEYMPSKFAGVADALLARGTTAKTPGKEVFSKYCEKLILLIFINCSSNSSYNTVEKHINR